MRAGAWHLAAALAVVLIPIAAKAQVVPPSDQPGRERQRFIEPPAAQSQPAGPVVTLPSTVAPPGADKVFVLVQGVEITGSTVYEPEAARSTLCGHGRPARVARRRLCAGAENHAKYGNDGYVLSRAIVPPQQLNPEWRDRPHRSH